MKKIFLFALLAASVAYAAVNQTQIITVRAVASDNPGSYASGSCFMKSLWSNRSDAWRCNINPGPNSQVYDPCFAVPNSSNLVVCGILPGINNNGFTAKITSFTNKSTPAEGYWAMQLADGAYCRVLDIAPLLPPLIANKKGQIINNYGIDEVCSNNPQVTGRSAQDVNLAGSAILANSVTQGKVWTAKRVYYSAIANDPAQVRLLKVETVHIAKVWQ